MVRYVAKHHVGLHNYTARPGELIEEALDDETVQRLLNLEAIEEVDLPEEPEPPENPSGQEGQEPPESADNQDAAVYEDAPAPEIDAMDGISSAVEEAPKTKSTRKTSKSGGKAE